MLKRLLHVINLLLIISAGSAGVLYAIEYYAEPELKYYGSIPVKDEYHYPDLIELYTFGDLPHDNAITIEFANELWCYPDGVEARNYSFLIEERIRKYTGFKFRNDISLRSQPNIMSAGGEVVNTDTSRTIGYNDIQALREVGPDNFESWFFDDIRPDFSGQCYIEHYATTFTSVFKIRKTQHFKGPVFNYFID